MQRTLHVSGKARTIHTTNGVDTTTAAVYLRNLKPYDHPLPNGFNAELGDEMWFQIVSVPLLWEQGSWRDVFYLNDVSLPVETAIREAVNAPKKDARCGTAMCAAGWVGELGGADWVADNAALQAGDTAMAEAVLVLKQDWQSWCEKIGWDGSTDLRIAGLSPGRAQRLASRGFTDRSHVIVSVSRYALMRLGLRDDYVGLFGGSNSLARIRACLDVYAQFGDLVEDDTRRIMEARDRATTLEYAYDDRVHQDFAGDSHEWAKSTLAPELADA